MIFTDPREKNLTKSELDYVKALRSCIRDSDELNRRLNIFYAELEDYRKATAELEVTR